MQGERGTPSLSVIKKAPVDQLLPLHRRPPVNDQQLLIERRPSPRGGGDPSVLDANYPPQLTVGRRPLGGGGGGSGRANGGGIGGGGGGVQVGQFGVVVGGGSRWGDLGCWGGGGGGSPYLPLPSL